MTTVNNRTADAIERAIDAMIAEDDNMTASQRRAIDAYRAIDRIVTVELPNPNRTVNFTVRNVGGDRVIYYQVGIRGGVTNMGYSCSPIA